PPILLAQAIGRIGNYFNQELYGRATTQPWGLEIYERVDANGRLDPLNGVSTGFVEKVVHPTFLYELLWSVAVVVLLVLVDRKYTIGHGRLFALYVAGYCAGRFWVELMRDDFATTIAGIRVNTFTSAIIFVLALVYFVIATKGREEPATLRSNDDEDRETASVDTSSGAGGSRPTPVDDTTDAGSVDAQPSQASDKKAEEEGSTRG
ncbi:MAG: prolipoprotein diacylglyceryl transferase family protein, partial [Rhodococcus sp. (in: high G+C Gram-positive bacteria)]